MFKIKRNWRNRFDVFERRNGRDVWQACFASAEAAFQWAGTDYAASLVADAERAAATRQLWKLSAE